MAKIIYHKGTGTYFGLDDDVVIIDLDRIPEKIDAEVMDTEGDEIAIYWGQPLRLLPENCIDYSPSALREEAQAMLDNGPYGDEELDGLIKWAATEATDNDLRTIGTFMLNDDTVWETYRFNVIQGLRSKEYLIK